ncbi:MAG: PQQ-binding-like beta-propeller repeat protein [Acidobacteria bacterium]|nr:PQQ-binding-like beta-propeller repeat protein [Acidobacteriota bacterium]
MTRSNPRSTNRLAALVLSLVMLAALAPAAGAQDSAGVRMVPPEGDGARYWSRWRGPSGQGVVEGTGYPDRWSDTENVLWKVPVPGRGHSSPIVWEDRIFLTTSRDRGRRVSILAFRRSDGMLLWQADAPNGPGERTHGKNSPASATVTTDGERCTPRSAAAGCSPSTSTATSSGTMLSRIDNYHGPAGSPLLYRDSIIIYQDQNRGAFVIALDARTGETRWRTPRAARVGWGTPIAISVGDHDELIVSSQRYVQSYNPSTGEELWRCEGMLREVIPTPAVGHGLVYCASGRAGPTLAIRPGGRGDVTRTHVEWSITRGSPFVPSPTVYGDYLYQINDMSSILTNLNARTGETVWQERLGRPRREGISASPIVVDDKLFVTNDEGQTFVLKTGPDFEILHVNDIGAPTLASPALVDGIWYIRTADQLFAIGH